MKNTLIRNIVKYVRSAAMLIAAIVIAVPASGQDIPDADGLFTKKYISSFDYDTMEGVLSLETFVTGEMKLVTVPFDVVLVLDNSQSMNGTPISDLKKGCKSLVSQMNEMCNNGNDARLAIVTYNNDATKVADLTKVDNTGMTSINTAIDNINTQGATHPEAGFEQALTIINTQRTGRENIPCYIIFFTDGEPGKDGGVMSVAQSSIAASWNVKKLGVKVYSIGLFSNDPSEKWIEEKHQDLESYKWITDYDKTLSVKDFLEHMSSLYNGVTSLSATKYVSKTKPASITWNGDTARNTDGIEYYKWAKSASDLDGIFKDIGAQIIGIATKSLTEETVVKDIISADCTLPDGVKVEDVKVYSATCTGGNKTDGYTFGDRSDETADVEIIVAENTVNVTNFNFGANWVGYNASTGKYQGKKLIVEIPFKVLPGALAGKDIKQLKTNGEKSGVYENGDSDDPIKPFPVPEIEYIDLIIKAIGLHPDESALFKVERKMAGEDGFSYFTTIALTGTSDEGTEVSSKILYQDPDATYKVTDLTGWSWTYAIQGATSLEKTSEEGQPIVFEFSNTKKENITIQNAEKSKDNRFSTYTSDGMTVTGNWFGNEKKL